MSAFALCKAGVTSSADHSGRFTGSRFEDYGFTGTPYAKLRVCKALMLFGKGMILGNGSISVESDLRPGTDISDA